jgi:hypothetical protein
MYRSRLQAPLIKYRRMWQQWTNVILGLWVIAVPFLGFTGTALSWTLAITGILIAALGAWGALENTPDTGTSTSQRMQHQ